MTLLALTLAAHLCTGAAADELPMPPPPPGMKLLPAEQTAPRDGLELPPPPPGMKLLADKDKEELVERAAAEEDEEALPPMPTDGPEASEQVEQQSVELEEMRALEEATLDPRAKPSLELLQSLRRLGFANPLRGRMEDALDELELREGELQLPPVTDIASFDVGLVKDKYDIPVEMQPLVAQYIQFFQGPGRKWFTKWMSRSTRYIPRMQPVLERHGLPKDMVYLAMIESGFSAHAYSWAHASGPWQFISSTGKMYGLKQDFWVDERRDPMKATDAAARYLKQLYKELGHWYLAWAGYNAGGGRIARLTQKKGTQDFWAISEGKGLAKETKHYVPKLIAAALVSKHPDAFGFSPDEFQFQPLLEFDEVPVSSPTDLEVLARAAGATLEEVQELNPELKRWCTPPASADKPYLLKIPKGRAAAFAERMARVPPQERLSFKSHVVQKGDTLSQIAQKYGSAAEAIMRLNGIKSAKYLKVRTALMIPVPSGGNPATRESAMQGQVARARRSGYAHRPDEEIPAGTLAKPSSALAGTIKTEQVNGKLRVSYGVASGDSLWTIGQRFDCTVNDLRGWNNLPKRKNSLRVGQLLTLWPGPKAGAIKDTGAKSPTAAR